MLPLLSLLADHAANFGVDIIKRRFIVGFYFSATIIPVNWWDHTAKQQAARCGEGVSSATLRELRKLKGPFRSSRKSCGDTGPDVNPGFLPGDTVVELSVQHSCDSISFRCPQLHPSVDLSIWAAGARRQAEYRSEFDSISCQATTKNTSLACGFWRRDRDHS